MNTEANRAGTGPAEVGSGRDSQGAVPARRSFLGWLLVVGSALVGAALSVPLVRFALHPLLSKTTETTWSEVGNAEDFSSLSSPVRRAVTVEHTDGWRKAVTQRAVYVTQDPSGRLVALSAVCPHLGCSIQWNDGKRQFVCPRHAGTFARDGHRVSGPPPRDMDALETAVKDGKVLARYQFFRQLVRTKEVIA